MLTSHLPRLRQPTGGNNPFGRAAAVPSRRLAPRGADGLATGWSQLDAALPAGGWPIGALTEVLYGATPLDALVLLLPALAALTRSARRVVLIEPPALPAPQLLRDHGIRLPFLHVVQNEAQAGSWDAEQYLRSGCAAAVVLWPHANDAARLRELQDCAATGANHVFAISPAARPLGIAALRVSVAGNVTGVSLQIQRSRSIAQPSTLLLPGMRYG